jgi:hypothetical protein
VLIEQLGIDEAALQLGHRLAETTQRYDRRGDKVLMRTAKILADTYGVYACESQSSNTGNDPNDDDWII